MPPNLRRRRPISGISSRSSFSTAPGRSLTGGALVDTKIGRIFNGWTVDGQLNAGSGLPSTPVAFVAVNGTGVVGVRPRLTGESTAPATAGSYANAAAYAAPLPGAWGDAGRNSIRGPSQFTFDMSVARTFLLPRRLRIDWRVNVTNVLQPGHVLGDQHGDHESAVRHADKRKRDAADSDVVGIRVLK